MLQSGRQIQALRAQGIDPFRFLVLPRGVACCWHLIRSGIVFVLVALLVGLGSPLCWAWCRPPPGRFLDSVLLATAPRDFIIFPVKMLAIGLLVARHRMLDGACPPTREDDGGQLIARGFVRGMLVVMLTSGLFSLAGLDA